MPRATARVVHTFTASPERVFDSWVDPVKLQTWLSLVNPLETVSQVCADAHIGGRFSYLLNRNGRDIEHGGEYITIERPRLLVFTWMGPASEAQSAIVTITITPIGSGCELSLVHDLDAAWGEMVPRFEKSWTKMLTAISAALGAA